MELPFKILVAVVVAAIILLIIIGLSYVVYGSGEEAIKNLWNIPRFIECLINRTQGLPCH